MENNASDIAIALEIDRKLNTVGVTENAIIPATLQGKDYVPRTLVDNTLELIDPTPNIHSLFVQFNARYFWNKLLPVEVKWSNRMTSCAGVCSFHPRNRQCIITLSVPLLKLRPRKDLVETLLHEMIHGYLFLTNNNRDRDGHGPEFHKHMYRINSEAGTNITVYHSFHNEVMVYQQHWWRCNGPCQTKSPYFGTVRRAMNRAPGPNDNWWTMHQQTCGGKFIKVREPDKQPPKSKKAVKDNGNKAPKSKDISDWLTKPDKPKNSASSSKSVTSVTSNTSKTTDKSAPPTNTPSPCNKLGNNANNIHGWGVGGPSSTAASPPRLGVSIKSPKFHASGVLGGSGTGKSNLLDKFPSKIIPGGSKPRKVPGAYGGGRKEEIDLTQTPNKRKSNEPGETSSKVTKHDEKISENLQCPICDKPVRMYKFNRHLDECLMCGSDLISKANQSTPKSSKNRYDDRNDSNSSIISIDSEDTDCPSVIGNRRKCLVCDNFIDPRMTLNVHLESCIGSAFTDDSFPELDDNDEDTNGNEISEKNFPCPICMALIGESCINHHLDICLSADLLKNYIE